MELFYLIMVAQAAMIKYIFFAAMVPFGFAQDWLTAHPEWHSSPLTLSLSKGLQLRLRRIHCLLIRVTESGMVTSKIVLPKEVLTEEYKVPGDKIVVITNGANTDLFKPMDITISREKLKLNQSNSCVCFAGTFLRGMG
jgi:hypothetical protein